jgi:hypothetical protein
MVGWMQLVDRVEPLRYGRYQLTLSCGCVLTRTANRRPKSGRARCEKQPQCKWRMTEVVHAG